MKNILFSLAMIFVFDSVAINPKIDWQAVKTTTPEPMNPIMSLLAQGGIIGTMSEASAETDAIIIAANWYSQFFVHFFDKPVIIERGYSFSDSFDNLYRAGGVNASTIKIFNNSNRQLYKEIETDQAIIDHLDFSPIGHIVASTSYWRAATVKAWDIVTGTCLNTITLDEETSNITWRELLGDEIISSLAQKKCPDLNSLLWVHQEITGKLGMVTINS